MIMPCSVNDCVKPDLESKVPIADKLPWGVAEPAIAEAKFGNSKLIPKKEKKADSKKEQPSAFIESKRVSPFNMARRV